MCMGSELAFRIIVIIIGMLPVVLTGMAVFAH
jgi:hypothetical protein